MTTEITVDDILAKLNKDTLSKLRRGSEITKETIPTASFGLNHILGGGLRIGKQSTFWGNEQSGKTAFMLHTIGINQELNNLPCAWIDAEHSFDFEWAERLGVDTDKLMVSQVSTIAEATDLQVELINAGMRMLVIDSTSALMPRSLVDKDTGEIKPFLSTAQQGQVAKDLGQMCKTVQGINYNCAVNHISQVRVDLGATSMTKPFKPVGGKEVEHTDSLRVRMFSSKSEKEALMENVQRGDLLIEEAVGRTVTWKIDKNKLNGRLGTGDYGLYTQRDPVGVDKASEILSYGIKYGIVNKAGSWVTVYDEKMQGLPKAAKYLRENAVVLEKLEREILDKSV